MLWVINFYGYSEKSYLGPDRSNLYYKCGNPRHKAKDCPAPECCVLYREIGLDTAELVLDQTLARCLETFLRRSESPQNDFYIVG